MRHCQQHANFFIENMERQAEIFKAAGRQPGIAE